MFDMYRILIFFAIVVIITSTAPCFSREVKSEIKTTQGIEADSKISKHLGLTKEEKINRIQRNKKTLKYLKHKKELQRLYDKKSKTEREMEYLEIRLEMKKNKLGNTESEASEKGER